MTHRDDTDSFRKALYEAVSMATEDSYVDIIMRVSRMPNDQVRVLLSFGPVEQYRLPRKQFHTIVSMK